MRTISATPGDVQERPGDVGRLVRAEPCDGLGDLFREAGAAHRNGVLEAFDTVRLPTGGVNFVSTIPGRTALTRIPSVASSFERPSVMASMAALAEA